MTNFPTYRTLFCLSILLLMSTAPLLARPCTNATAPELSTRLSADYALEMPSLKPYPIYINASVELPDTMDRVEIEIDGTTYTAVEEEGFYYYLWTPSSYGSHSIVITAFATSGDDTTLNRTINVSNSINTQTVRSLEDIVIEFNGTNSRWYYGTYTFPQFVGAYNNIQAFLEVECPNVNGGCDDWDRWAHIDVKAPDGNWVQIMRYITPYGVGCDHEIDVTDYMSLLQGEVEMRVFIDTWGTGGWQLTLDFDYQQGVPDFAYSNVTEVWDDGYSFGDPANLFPVETAAISIPQGILDAHLNISTTGHGWGQNNTANAAEFFNGFQFIDVDGEETFTYHLWNICNPNPDGCTGQLGSWQFPRAGWCPGAIAHPEPFDLNPMIGTNFDLDYRFHTGYVDQCHPNNPDCVSGTTCPDCNDGFNPIYFVDVHVINRSNNPIVYTDILGNNPVDNVLNYDVRVFPNPSSGQFSIRSNFPDGSTRVSLHTIDGTSVKVFYFDNASAMNDYTFDLSNLATGVYFINIQNAHGTGSKKLILE
ncbi:MAG: T9SS type A sorting domain-containing protein [Bacteroidota bacterium]